MKIRIALIRSAARRDTAKDGKRFFFDGQIQIMKIRAKIILTALPLIITPLLLAGLASYFSAANDIGRGAERFLSYKSAVLQRYAESQWALLVENNYAGRADMDEAAQKAVELYAQSIITSEPADMPATEKIFAVDATGAVVMGTSAVSLSGNEKEELLRLLGEENRGIMTAIIGGVERVFKAFYFPPFRWHVVTSEEKAVFYHDINSIKLQTAVITAASSVLAVALLILLSSMLTSPLSKLTRAMNAIITKGDMSGRVSVEYRDETGNLAGTFNMMITGLEHAYHEIKRHAFEAVLAQKKEQRIRQIFQKYVPKDLIDKFFASPESMLAGDNRDLPILFSDIRGFTTISESMRPDELVHSLNRYFSGQVDIIMNRNGIVDKYIGDAIMAFWGAPVKHEDDIMQSVLSGLDMIDALNGFNAKQREIGKPEFHVGIGINYGTVTVGNIGSERKMDYTVIGDTVNLASRLEGLTKVYHADMLVSESVYNALREQSGLPFHVRLLDTVAVKGKTKGVKIFAVKRNLTEKEARAWNSHNQGMKLYYSRSFAEAAARFRQTLALLPKDFNATALLERAEDYAQNPPPPDWDGVEVMKSK
ncbi:MAG: adenylate/guanylate cyclase domain-containing protein [Treponema sp.]|jgi:class 3 adenylate cyclase/HAMP domain-containing protein|nr:adenylate/guanylate cyclase domain-containing protein [Treponema sp.]